MKRILLFCVAAVFLFPGPAGADLFVYEYIPGEKVTLDDVTGYYWYWNLPDFCNMTYDEQTAAISDLGTYGYIAGGWHLADADEMLTMWESDVVKIMININPHDTYLPPDEDELIQLVWGRYDGVSGEGTHYSSYVGWDESTGAYLDSGLPGLVAEDDDRIGGLGAWVVTQQPIVPAPGAIILAVTGLLSSTLGLNRLRRKRKEPSQI